MPRISKSSSSSFTRSVVVSLCLQAARCARQPAGPVCIPPPPVRSHLTLFLDLLSLSPLLVLLGVSPARTTWRRPHDPAVKRRKIRVLFHSLSPSPFTNCLSHVLQHRSDHLHHRPVRGAGAVRGGHPLDQFRSTQTDELQNTNCLTLWGCKKKCYDSGYSFRIKDNFPDCPDRTNRFKAAEAFSIITIGLAFVCFFLAVCMDTCCSYCKCCVRIVVTLLNILAVAGGAVVWGCMVASYHNEHNTCPALKDHYACTDMGANVAEEDINNEPGSKYGAGFALFLVGWILQTINLLIILLPC
eukprot:gene7476-biopygen5074